MSFEIDKKWQQQWESEGLYDVDLTVEGPHFYLLSMFPYPSGNLHLGHWYAFAPADAYARFMRMQGYQVFFPIGFDAFGLPAENAAIKHGVQPAEWTDKNIEKMTAQLKSMGCMFPWKHTLKTCDPRYYKWNQWIFLKFLEKGLAYHDVALVDYCPSCKTTIAKEQIVDGECERCQTAVVYKELPSWKLRITNYEDELLNFDGMEWPEKVVKMQKEWIKGLRDWNISRQRKWGTPIPIINCSSCGAVPVPEKDLPVLVDAPKECACPKCGIPAERESDTMDTFFCSSWYQYAYLSPYREADNPVDVALFNRWPVNLYTGGIEHACMHLLYFRFFTKAMIDCDIFLDPAHPTVGAYFPADWPRREPARKLFNQGMILGPDNQKMSKSRGNVIDPDELVEEHGADVVRAALMFAGPWDQGGSFSTNLTGIERFLEDVESIATREAPSGKEGWSGEIGRMSNRILQRYRLDMQAMKFNTAISWLMQYRNAMLKHYESCTSETWVNAVDTLLLMLAPIAPHRTEELWRQRKGRSIHIEPMPIVLTADFKPAEVTEVVIQINGKKRIVVQKCHEDDLDDVLEYPEVVALVDGLEITKTVKVQDKLINFVIKRTIDS